MVKDIFKVTVQRGSEDIFMAFCNEKGISHRQYPHPITWAFRVENTPEVPNAFSLVAGLDCVIQVEDMPTVSLS